MEQKGSGSDQNIKKGLWTIEEDKILLDYIALHGKGNWNRLAKLTGLKRRGKSCRLRWMNYLSPNIKRGDFSEDEDDLIIRLHNLLGNRWSLIAGRVPGRTDNQVKNHWNTHLSKKLRLNKKTKSVQPPTSMDREAAVVTETETKTSGSSQPLVSVTSAEEQRVNIQQVSCWGFSNDFLNFDSHDLMELVNDHSLGFVWQHL
ncbi:hypothetical protein ACFE04_018102 [Oxalis oulophora]